jgi:hypothetical protein
MARPGRISRTRESPSHWLAADPSERRAYVPNLPLPTPIGSNASTKDHLTEGHLSFINWWLY